MKHLSIFFGIISIIIFIGCSTNDQYSYTENNDEHPSVAITHWTDKMEIFMEYPVLVKNTTGIYHPSHIYG